MMAWWRSRSPRERALIGLLGVVAAAIVYWQFLWAPLRSAADAAERRHAAAVADARAIEAAAARLSTQATADPGSERSLRAEVSSLAAASGLTLSRLQPEGGGALTVWIEPAPPGAVFGFVARLSQERGIEPTRISVEKAGDGMVQAQATFEEVRR